MYNKAARVIETSDLVVIAPGDLYTSVIPVLLVEGVVESILSSKADLAYVVNLMTKKEETASFKASDFVREIKKYLGEASGRLKYVLVNKRINHSTSQIRRWYKKFGSMPVENDLKSNKHVKIIEGNFVSTTTFFRHDPEKLSRAIISLIS